ncbi:hypothetical protein KAFR_0H03400 [Kazachstania africana CBS 2517]|uniref:2-(3-amino-3-carboxypropyl)histidine synthase subunit 1 n=1 Tax=Kazachstania africana (strain ATCC 22294 / BCRC 22015 / CBS 2517 / CECT 1963 / NBRC 1671 / NRRL Y-8276) TaxID=1071382 RepID=H2AYH3_KAZAF|nr:hypothetical protein KAFR_0H03400 [Kazachstania africana CBS 2517]CCF59750.1 hypothetical protein KAFR_0H03400 [Kazachstania africana CBS 2517]
MSEVQRKVPRRRFVGSKSATGDKIKTVASNGGEMVAKGSANPTRSITRIPDDILNDENLNNVVEALLPSNYNFEIHKTIWNIRKHNATRVALQMPEGLLIYSLIISDILEQFCGVETVVMGDVSYGACCIDDYTARSLDCDFIIHYAHSCLVPIDITTIRVLYVFVTITINEDHIIKTLRKNFDRGQRIALFGTIQFNPAIHSIKERLLTTEDDEHVLYAIPPQIKPLSRGEVLGCTSELLDPNQFDAMVFIGDGRFHLESAMIHNSKIPAYRYDPYNRKFTREGYDQAQLVRVRSDAIETSRKANVFGIILGGLGRQGNVQTAKRMEEGLKKMGKTVVKIILSEIFPQKLAMFDQIDAFVQVACPRLSIDWGYAFNKPLLTPYEASVLMGKDIMFTEDYYPMDYYEANGYGRGNVPAHSSF